MIQYKIKNFANSSGIAAKKKASKNDLLNGDWNNVSRNYIGISRIKVIMIDRNPPKKHLANNLIDSLFLSLLIIK